MVHWTSFWGVGEGGCFGDKAGVLHCAIGRLWRAASKIAHGIDIIATPCKSLPLPCYSMRHSFFHVLCKLPAVAAERTFFSQLILKIRLKEESLRCVVYICHPASVGLSICLKSCVESVLKSLTEFVEILAWFWFWLQIWLHIMVISRNPMVGRQ